MKDLKPYQKRLIIEYRELVHRYDRLRAFLDTHDDESTQTELMRRQLGIMLEYRFVLLERMMSERINPADEYDPIADAVEALAADRCESESMCEGNPMELDEADQQTAEAYRDEARHDIETALNAIGLADAWRTE